jgi:hypothetical protein
MSLYALLLYLSIYSFSNDDSISGKIWGDPEQRRRPILVFEMSDERHNIVVAYLLILGGIFLFLAPNKPTNQSIESPDRSTVCRIDSDWSTTSSSASYGLTCGAFTLTTIKMGRTPLVTVIAIRLRSLFAAW